MNSTLKFFSAQDVHKALSMQEAIRAMASAFTQLSGQRTVTPLRSSIEIPGSENSALFMPVYLPGSRKIAVKTVTVFPGNTQRKQPAIQALITLFDAQNGQPLAVVDGTALTAIRTGAASGLATELLARTDAQVLALFGAGVQGGWQIEAVLSVRSIQKVLIFDPDKQRAQTLAEHIVERYDVKTIVSINSAELREADIICTATTSQAPVFKDADLKPGVHINAVGAFRPDMREIPALTMQRALVVVDERRACLKEAGELIIPINQGVFVAQHIYAEIGDLTAGRVKGRENNAQITLFKSVGNAVQDLAAAEIVLQNGLKMNLGQTVQM